MFIDFFMGTTECGCVFFIMAISFFFDLIFIVFTDF